MRPDRRPWNDRRKSFRPRPGGSRRSQAPCGRNGHGLQARWTFTDGAPSSTGYAISSSTGSLSTGGTDALNHCDDCVTPLALPFPVTIYDQTFTTATVSSNGTVQLTAPFTAEYRNAA